MTHLFVPYEQSLELKKLDFDEPCFGYYRPNEEFDYLNWEIFKDFPYLAKNSEWRDLYASPTYQQVFKWFRENHNMLATIYSNASGFLFEWHDTKGGTSRGDSGYDGPNNSGCWDTYEEAELACIIKLIETVKSNQI